MRRGPPPRTVERFLHAAAARAGIPIELLSPDVVLDATVPGWRVALSGADAAVERYSRWSADPAEFEELERLTFDDGEVVTYLLIWVERESAHSASLSRAALRPRRGHRS